MTELTTPPELIRQMIDRMRAVADRDAREGDPSQRELRAEIDGLDEEHRHELAALLWAGRGVFEGSEWEEALLTAAGRDHVLRDGVY